MSEQTPQPDPLAEFSEDQIKTLQEVYSYTDAYEYSEDDLKLAREMFDTPEKFLLLRKILGVHTPNEQGLTMKSPQSLIEASVTDLQAYAIESAVNALANEKVRTSLVAFYRVLLQQNRQEKADEFREENKAEFEQQQRKEAAEAQAEEDARTLPENV